MSNIFSQKIKRRRYGSAEQDDFKIDNLPEVKNIAAYNV
jgi:hypothetical protein